MTATSLTTQLQLFANRQRDISLRSTDQHHTQYQHGQQPVWTQASTVHKYCDEAMDPSDQKLGQQCRSDKMQLMTSTTVYSRQHTRYISFHIHYTLHVSTLLLHTHNGHALMGNINILICSIEQSLMKGSK